MSSYDQNLLDEAPKATRAQMQEGYNIDLLEQPPRRNPSVRIAQPPPVLAPVPLTPGVAENGSREKFSSPIQPYATAPRKSFWRSRNGIITIIFIAVVIVGAVVGGAVGGTVGKKGKSSNLNSSGSTGDTSSSPGGPVGIPFPSSTSFVLPLPSSTPLSSTSTGTPGTQGAGGSPTTFPGSFNPFPISSATQTQVNLPAAQAAAPNAVAADFPH